MHRLGLKSAAKRRRVEPPRKTKRARSKPARPDRTEAALASLAHEIRTPLNGVLALSELLAAADLPEREREWATQIRGAAEHLAHLATLVVDGVRAERRGLVLRLEPFRLRGLAEAVGATLSARAEMKGLAVELAIPADLPDLAIGDRVRLRAALENLADNAVKFTERGRVALTVSVVPAARGRLRLGFDFADSGIGLSAKEIERLFRPFAQASAGVARRYGGAGLGLAFVRRLARAMGGDLTVESRPGRGSAFRLSVVVRSARAGTRANGASANTDAGATSLRVLCVEDNPIARVVLKTVLTELGHAVEFAGTGEAAIAAIGRGAYDLVLMDVTLPTIDGLEATRAIRSLEGTAARVPVIGISGRSDVRDAEAAKAAGMNAFLGKPVSPAALAQAIAELTTA